MQGLLANLSAKLIPGLSQQDPQDSQQDAPKEEAKTGPITDEQCNTDAMDLLAKTTNKFCAKRNEYDPFHIPPDFELAKAHAEASRVKNLHKKFEPDEAMQEEDFCPCCNLPKDAELFPICTNEIQLGELGSGFTLFFDLLKWLILICLIAMVITLYCLVDNFTAGNAADYDDESEGNVLIASSIANHGDENPSTAQAWLNCIVIMLTLWVIYPLINVRHNKLVQKIDEGSVTPSDFTL